MKFDGPLLNDRWRLGPRMGSGAQARTYLARDERQKRGANSRGTVVVLKQFDLAGEKKGWKSFDLFEREVRVLKKLRHPCIPRFIEAFESGSGVYNLVMEKKPGATLRAIATKVRFTDDELRDILAKVLEILDTIHRNEPPVIHRDVKPANLVRDARGNISLVDFGGVRDAIRESGGSTVVGTFGYMAPEQLHGEATAATDLYSLGATLVSLAGKVEPEDVPRKGLRMDLGKHLRDRDPNLVAILQALTEPDPEQRPRSAREVAEMLRSPAVRATAAIAPVSSDRQLQQLERQLASRPFDEVGEMLADLPRPLAVALRILLLAFSLGGYVAVAAVQAVLIPLMFAVAGAVAGEQAKPRIVASRREVDNALDEGRHSLRSLQAHTLPSSRRRKSLPKPK